ncbi:MULTISPECIES: alpha/beta fold hydrolase [unclassified Microbacterium]|uniref:alpha/beta fold hydrolase n=1 Tax=unclassified Microbacterium TaxID=2609290 RepID=UPI0016052D64|nr:MULTISPECIES: alpha/beta fold hydrolase [unclassified Microbacterium]QNA92769.1 alpha/beta hydrolase [Microbacterium sp. Se63.02b]QYM62913.1 alpha/beta hydrolase [Microbacterium sp. Se5.02b]
MDIILIPGLWLDASSWDEVTPTLERAGHRVHALTMPGWGAPASDSGDIGIADWVTAAVAAVDSVDGDVAVVGHSGGGNVAWGVADARPDHVSRVIFIDTVPPPPGNGISEFDVVDGVVPFPGWDFFPEEDIEDLDAETRAHTLPLTRGVPARVPTDGIALTDPGRYRVPVTLLMGGLDSSTFDGMIDQWQEYAAEFHAIDDAEVVRIGSGHWPQFSVPQRLGELIDAAIAR